jgi:hypothetical protein
MARSLDDNRLYFLLTRNDQLDTRRLAIVADLLHQEGDIYAALGRAEESRQDIARALSNLDESRQDTARALRYTEESRQDYARALRFDVEVFFNAGDGEQAAGEQGSLQAKIEDLVEKLDLAGQGERLGADTLWPLAGYYEETGAYARAERLLLALAGRAEIRAEILPEVVAFYERLAQKPPEALAEGGTSLEQVRAGLRRWRV